MLTHCNTHIRFIYTQLHPPLSLALTLTSFLTYSHACTHTLCFSFSFCLATDICTLCPPPLHAQTPSIPFSPFDRQHSCSSSSVGSFSPSFSSTDLLSLLSYSSVVSSLSSFPPVLCSGRVDKEREGKEGWEGVE